jgi:hypothetical protein
VHRTVSGAPTGSELQRSDAPDLEGDRAPDSYRDCPVVHRTVLPSWPLMAPSCLGAIKRTPRRMEESPQVFTKHPKTPRLQLHAFDSL